MNNNKFNIIHVVPSISEEDSGPSYSVFRLCQTLVEMGEEISLAVLELEPSHDTPPFIKSFSMGLGPKRLGCSPAMKNWLSEQAKPDNSLIMHNHGLWMMPNIYTGQVAKAYQLPNVISPRGTLSEWAFKSGSPLKKLFWPLLQKPVLKSASFFHATSYSEYVDIRRMNFRQPVAIIPNGIDIPKLTPKAQSTLRTLLFLGRIHPIKGLELLLPAWKAVQNKFPEWKLRIVGPDSNGYKAKMKALAKNLLIERIEFCGPLHGKSKWEAYNDADLFILPSFSENFGMTVAESLSAGTPAIVTKGAPWEGIEDHRAGWYVDICSDAITAALEKALSLPKEYLASMGFQGKKWMSSSFSWEIVGQKMKSFYRWVLDGQEPPEYIMFD